MDSEWCSQGFQKVCQQLQQANPNANQYFDINTQEVIPYTQISKIHATLSEVGHLVKRAEGAFSAQMKATNGNYQLAKQASEAILPAGRSRTFDRLTDENILCNIMIIGPPVVKPAMQLGMTQRDYDRKVRMACYDTQHAMHDLILRLHKLSLIHI